VGSNQEPVISLLKKKVLERREEAARVSRDRVGKALIWDIETSPLMAAVWGLKNDWIPLDAILRDSFIICGAWKWLGGRRIYHTACDSDHIASYWAGETDKSPDLEVVSTLRNMVREADFIVGHNGDKFDLRKLNARVISHDLPPLPSVRTCDTLKEARKVGFFDSNRLEWLSTRLTGAGKIKTGMDLWVRVLNGEKKAMKEMVTYNRRDVEALEDVYLQLRPYMKSHPNLGVDPYLDDGVQVCALCGSENIQRDGHHRTQARIYARFLCKSCGGHSRATRADGEGVLRACAGRHP